MARFAPPDKRRPVLILTRDSVLQFLNRVTVAPITKTRRGVASELLLGPEHGFKFECAVNFHNVITLPQSEVGALVATLSEELMESACSALEYALGCKEQTS